MNMRLVRPCTICALALSAILTAGCAENLRNKQLGKVAKDWSLVVRASQVIPVYPLTEDLQPGDVMLVRTPVEAQVELYKDKGFLPLDQLVWRGNPTSVYQDFYLKRYGTDDDSVPPARWQKEIVLNDKPQHQWQLAPHAAFPSYSFQVSSGGGLNLALPIQGVPFALGVMSTGKASGSVTIADAYTYGLDNVVLEQRVRNWADLNRELLRRYSPVREKDGKITRYHFLRVVSRVYAAGRVSVTVQNDQATSGEAGAGADLPVTIAALKDKEAVANYTSALSALNTTLANQLPGAKVKVAAATSRSVTLNEEFTRPLVIGYVGFDLPILEGGRLGAPISTLEQLTGQRPPVLPAGWTENGYRYAALSQMYQSLRQLDDADARKLQAELDNLAQDLPAAYPYAVYEMDGEGNSLENPTAIKAGDSVMRDDFFAVTDFLMNTLKTITTLELYLPAAPRGTDPEKAAVVAKEKELATARKKLAEMNELLRAKPALVRAIDLVFLGEHS